MVGVGQGSALSPILSALYLASLLYSFYKRLDLASLISYIDNGTIIIQSKMWESNISNLWNTYFVIHKLMASGSLLLEHDKSEVFHFSHHYGDENPLIDLGFAPFMGDTPLKPKEIWRYLGFFFDC